MDLYQETSFRWPQISLTEKECLYLINTFAFEKPEIGPCSEVEQEEGEEVQNDTNKKGIAVVFWLIVIVRISISLLPLVYRLLYKRDLNDYFSLHKQANGLSEKEKTIKEHQGHP